MPKGVYKRTKKHYMHKGYIPWNKGKPAWNKGKKCPF